MKTLEWEPIAAYYQKGHTADMLQAETNGKWGVMWTVPSCSPNALGRAGRQFTQSRAHTIRYFRLAMLRKTGADAQRVVVMTILPFGEQGVYSLENLCPVPVSQFLSDEALQALAESFIPFPTPQK